jgi:hypothetical protein
MTRMSLVGQSLAVSDTGFGFELVGWSRACVGGVHLDCGHVKAGMRRLVSGDRLQSTIALCRCPCHAACALAERMPVSLTVWQQLCRCPGGERMRAWKEDPDNPWPGAKEAREKQQRESQESHEAHQEAMRAARDAAPGKTRAEVRELYIAELRARGQEVPPEPILDVEVEFLIGHPLRAFWKMKKALLDPFTGP